jgi:hypothetical protein
MYTSFLTRLVLALLSALIALALNISSPSTVNAGDIVNLHVTTRSFGRKEFVRCGLRILLGLPLHARSRTAAGRFRIPRYLRPNWIPFDQRNRYHGGYSSFCGP